MLEEARKLKDRSTGVYAGGASPHALDPQNWLKITGNLMENEEF